VQPSRSPSRPVGRPARRASAGRGGSSCR
jgi:hypothetical protein